MESERRIVLNAATNASRVVVWILVAAIQTPVLVRALGAEGFGAWQLALSTAGFLAFLDFGLGPTLVRFGARFAGKGDIGERNRVASTLFAVYLGLGATAGLVALAILAGARGAWSSELQLAFVLVALRSVVLLMPLSTFRGLLFGHQLIVEVNACQGASLLGCGITTILAAPRWPSLPLLAAIQLAWMLAEHAAYAALAFRLIPRLELSAALFDRKLLAEMVAFGLKQCAIDASKLVEMKLGVVLVAHLVSLSAAGLYALALRIVEAVHLLVKQGVNVLAPFLASRHGAGDAGGVRRTLLVGTRYTLAIATLALVPVAVSAPDLLLWWIGPEAAGAAPLVRILAASTLLALSLTTASVVLAMTDRENVVAVSALTAAAVDAGASLTLGTLFGLPGVACGPLVAGLAVDVPRIGRAALRELGVSASELFGTSIAPSLAGGLLQVAAATGVLLLAGRTMPVVVLAHLAGVAAFVTGYVSMFLEPWEVAAIAKLLPGEQAVGAGDPARPRGTSAEPALHVVHVPRRFVRSAWGGTETLVLELSRGLLALGHRPAIFTTRALSTVTDEVIADVPVRRFAHFYPYLGLSADRRAELELRGGNPFSLSLMAALFARPELDLIHVHTGKRLGGIARVVARRRGIPYVVTLNGGVYDVPPAEEASLSAPARGALEWGKALGFLVGSRRVLEDASAIVCVGQREYDLTRERHPGQRVVYIPNGVDPDRFARGDGAAFRRAHGIPDRARVILCVGRVDPQKNQLQLVRLLPRWRARFPGARLVLVGPATSAEYAARVASLARELGVADAVTLAGAVEPDARALVDAYHAADAFVLPSRHEPFGIAVLEAWAAGRPVVAARTGGLPGFVRHGTDALLATPEDDEAFEAAVAGVLADRALAGRLGAEGARRCRSEFSWARCTERLVELYRSVIAESRAHDARRAQQEAAS